MGIFNNRFFTRLLGVAIVGVVCIVMGLSSLIGALSFRSDITKNIENGENIIDFMYQSDYKLNENLCGYIAYLYECFCEETTTRTVNGIKTSSSVSGSYYLMPIINYEENDDNTYYITVLVKDKDFTAECEQLVDDTYSYLSGNDNVEFHDCFFTGKVKPLDKEVKGYLVDWVNEVELFDDCSDATIDKYILPYQLEEYNLENRFNSAKILIPIGVVITAVCILIIFIVYKKNKNQSVENTSDNVIPDNDPQVISDEVAPAEQPAVITESAPAVSEEEKSSSFVENQAEEPPTPAVVEEKAEKTATVSEKAPTDTPQVSETSEMLTATVSSEDLNNLPDDSTAKPAFNYDDGGMGGIDVSALDLSSLDDYQDESQSDEPDDDNIYSDDDYTFDADPSSIMLSDMDK